MFGESEEIKENMDRQAELRSVEATLKDKFIECLK